MTNTRHVCEFCRRAVLAKRWQGTRAYRDASHGLCQRCWRDLVNSLRARPPWQWDQQTELNLSRTPIAAPARIVLERHQRRTIHVYRLQASKRRSCLRIV